LCREYEQLVKLEAVSYVDAIVRLLDLTAYYPGRSIPDKIKRFFVPGLSYGYVWNLANVIL
jgi:hypothetical protein